MQLEEERWEAEEEKRRKAARKIEEKRWEVAAMNAEQEERRREMACLEVRGPSMPGARRWADDPGDSGSVHTGQFQKV